MKKKKKGLIITLSVTSILSLLAFPTMVGINAFLLAPVFDSTFLGEMKEKIKKVKETEGKRVILIGGSSIPFGVDSQLLEDQLDGYQVIDFGLYASLGSNVMLDFVKARINKGDILIFMPEQDKQTLSLYYNGISLWQALDGHFSDRKYLSSEAKERMTGDLYAFSQSKFRYTFQEKLNLEGTIYRKDSFNDYLDINSELTPYNTMDELYDPTKKISFSKDILQEDFVSYVNDFASYARSRGASLYYHFGPMNPKAVEDKEDIDDYYDYLKEKLDFDLSGNPYDALLNEGYFYDTNYHLNGAGKRMFTKQLAKDIKLLLEDRSPTNIEDVPVPAIPSQEETDGDNSDADDFLYQEKEDGTYQILSLKKEKENIVVPYRYQGKRITGLDASVFASHPGIKEITIQNNIRSLLDYSFTGCSGLEKIHLKNPIPSSIRIGNNLLDGTDADIYVPHESYSLYVTDYNFSSYASRIKEE